MPRGYCTRPRTPSRHHACRGPPDKVFLDEARGALRGLVLGAEARSDDAENGGRHPAAAADLSLNGFMHLLTPLSKTLPAGHKAAAHVGAGGEVRGAADARALVDTLLQGFADEASERLSPQLPGLDANGNALPPKDPVATAARASVKPRAPPPIPLDEVRTRTSARWRRLQPLPLRTCILCSPMSIAAASASHSSHQHLFPNADTTRPVQFMHPYFRAFLDGATVELPRAAARATSTGRPRPTMTPPAASPRDHANDDAAASPDPAKARGGEKHRDDSAPQATGSKIEDEAVRGGTRGKPDTDTPAVSSHGAALSHDGGAATREERSPSAMEVDGEAAPVTMRNSSRGPRGVPLAACWVLAAQCVLAGSGRSMCELCCRRCQGRTAQAWRVRRQ